MKMKLGSDFCLCQAKPDLWQVPSRLHHSNLHIRRWFTLNLCSCCSRMKTKWSKSVQTSSLEAKIKYLVSLQFSYGTLLLQSQNEKVMVALLRSQTRKQLQTKKTKTKTPSSFSLLHSHPSCLCRVSQAGEDQRAEPEHVFCARLWTQTSLRAPALHWLCLSVPPAVLSAQSFNML